MSTFENALATARIMLAIEEKQKQEQTNRENQERGKHLGMLMTIAFDAGAAMDALFKAGFTDWSETEGAITLGDFMISTTRDLCSNRLKLTDTRNPDSSGNWFSTAKEYIKNTDELNKYHERYLVALEESKANLAAHQQEHELSAEGEQTVHYLQELITKIKTRHIESYDHFVLGAIRIAISINDLDASQDMYDGDDDDDENN
jgi:hypothetical protein